MNKQEEKQLKVFGYGLPLILGFFAYRHWMKAGGDLLSVSLLGAAVMMLIITLAAKPLLVRIFKQWMKVAGLIGFCVTGIILVILYYAVFTPVAAVLRLRGKDFMGTKRRGDSYWDKKESQGILRESYQRQF